MTTGAPAERPKIEPNSTLTCPRRWFPVGGRVEAEEEDAQAQHPGEDAADDHVVRAAAAAERAERSATAMVATNRPSRRSKPAARAASAPVNATWLSASPVKTCGAQHEEVADQAGGERDRRAGEEGVLEERLEDITTAGTACGTRGPPAT